ncbi:class I SAM-dependent methyltransferase [Fodinibius sp. SL11]|uniref:class I SAM-dependent methyltransferase n=1 Tax=Fodinibius sp. SL11 TaxID=3425690 RepID=UPI003F881C5F
MMKFTFDNFAKRGCITLLVIMSITSLSCGQAPGDQSDVDWLIEVLAIEDSSVVADIGAGDGDQTLAIARHIGPEGKIFSTELTALQELRAAVNESDLENITVLKGLPNNTNLPRECCNAIFMRRVYHHIDEPEAFNASLYQSLKPGGRLAIIDFKPRGSESEPEGRDSGSQHGVTAKTVIKELKMAGFSLLSSAQGSGRDIYVVMEKPLAN